MSLGASPALDASVLVLNKLYMAVHVISVRRAFCLLFKDLATLRTDAPLFRNAAELAWSGPSPAFAAWTTRLGDARLLERALKAPVGDPA